MTSCNYHPLSQSPPRHTYIRVLRFRKPPKTAAFESPDKDRRLHFREREFLPPALVQITNLPASRTRESQFLKICFIHNFNKKKDERRRSVNRVRTEEWNNITTAVVLQSDCGAAEGHAAAAIRPRGGEGSDSSEKDGVSQGDRYSGYFENGNPARVHQNSGDSRDTGRRRRGNTRSRGFVRLGLAQPTCYETLSTVPPFQGKGEFFKLRESYPSLPFPD